MLASLIHEWTDERPGGMSGAAAADSPRDPVELACLAKRRAPPSNQREVSAPALLPPGGSMPVHCSLSIRQVAVATLLALIASCGSRDSGGGAPDAGSGSDAPAPLPAPRP